MDQGLFRNTNCPHCNAPLVFENDGIYKYSMCGNAACQKGYFFSECASHVPVLVKTIKKDGKLMVQHQCMKCKEVYGQVKLNTVPNVNILPQRVEGREYERASNRLKRYYEERAEARKALFFSQHNEYLQSEEWRKKRLLVLKRDGYVCKACESAPATEVHHLSYKMWRNEPLFDLISVCSSCHKTIHENS